MVGIKNKEADSVNTDKRIAFLEGKLAAQDGVISDLKKEISALCPIGDVDTITGLVATIDFMKEMQLREMNAQQRNKNEMMTRGIFIRIVDQKSIELSWVCPICGGCNIQMVYGIDPSEALWVECNSCSNKIMNIERLDPKWWFK